MKAETEMTVRYTIALVVDSEERMALFNALSRQAEQMPVGQARCTVKALRAILWGAANGN